MARRSDKKKRSESEVGNTAAQAQPQDPVVTKAAQERAPLKPVHLRTIEALFFASGASSLIYQVVWTRMLVLVFGATSFATATVLSIFMGGLAIGSFFGGRLADRVKNPLLLYGILELVIGVWALLVPWLFDAAIPVYRVIWQHWHMSVMPFSCLRFIEAALILIVPTTCMGATLPLLTKYCTDSLAVSGKRAGALYSINTAGAISGAVLSGFFLLPTMGMAATICISAFINLVLFGAVYWLCKLPELASGARLDGTAGREPEPEIGNQTAPVATPSVWTVRGCIACFGLSGAIAMVYEVAWTRTLLMVVGSSTYAFTLMLAAFLTGIATGSWLASFFVRRLTRPVLTMALVQFGVGLLTIASMYTFIMVPYWNLWLTAHFSNNTDTSMLIRFALCLVTLAPCTLLLGALFPLVVQISTRSLQSLGQEIGVVYSANTFGAIAGAALAGFALIPLIGTEATLLLGAYLNMILAGLLFLGSEMTSRQKVASWVVSAMIVMGGLTYVHQIWDKAVILAAQQARRHLVSATERTVPSYETWLSDLKSRIKVLAWRDGACSNVGVRASENPRSRSLVTNGHVDASDGTDMTVQILLGALPLMANPDAKEVAVVGFGAGVTLGTVCQYPVEQVEAIEIEPAVVAMSPYFHHVNHAPETNPKVQIQYNDGRNYLLVTDKKYDVIISEPSNPWQSGVCNLFTSNYFRLASSRLNRGGVFALWEQTSEVPHDCLKAVFSALTSVFPHVVACNIGYGNVVVLASNDPIKFAPKRIAKLMENKGIAADLARLGITSPELLLRRLFMADNGIRAFAAGATANSDDHNTLEFKVARSYENAMYTRTNQDAMLGQHGDLAKHIDWSDLKPSDAAVTLAELSRVTPQLEGSEKLADYWMSLASKGQQGATSLRLLGEAAFAAGDQKKAFGLWEQSLLRAPKDLRTLEVFGNTLIDCGQLERGRAHLQKMMEYAPSDKTAPFWMARSYTDLSPFGLSSTYPTAARKLDWEPATVLKWLGGLPEDKEFYSQHRDVLFMAAEANYRLHKLPEAEKLIQRYLKLVPSSGSAMRFAGAVAYEMGNRPLASAYWYAALVKSKSMVRALANTAQTYLDHGNEEAAIKTLILAQEIFPAQTVSVDMLRELGKKNARAKQEALRMKSLQELSMPK